MGGGKKRPISFETRHTSSEREREAGWFGIQWRGKGKNGKEKKKNIQSWGGQDAHVKAFRFFLPFQERRK